MASACGQRGVPRLLEGRPLNPLILALSAALFAASSALADDIRTERVHFKKGATSATVAGTIKGYEGVDYVLGARAGQAMNVSMATDNTANYFNIIAPGKTDEAMFIGSTSGNQFDGTHAVNGTIYLETRSEDFQSSYNAAGDTLVNFYAEGQSWPTFVKGGGSPHMSR